jgi:sulfonate transport system substrate-binding protein
VGLGLSIAVSACSPSTTDNGNTQTAQTPQTIATTSSTTTVRIGYQKAATVLNALKARGELEKAFASAGTSVTWAEFPAGPPMLEAYRRSPTNFCSSRRYSFAVCSL